MRAAIERYLSLTCGSDERDHEALQALAWALDDLLIGLRELEEGEPADNEAEPPPVDHQAVAAEISRRFPDLGFYPTAAPLDLENPEILIGDAVDDAADIAIDLAAAIWRWDHLGSADAAWHIHFDFKTHWGQHLVDLRRHLHARLCAVTDSAPSLT